MANEENLIPFNERTENERRELAARGGRASGEARRTRKTLREYAEFLLGLPVADRRKFNKLSRMGVPVESIDNKMMMVAALMVAAQSGDVQAVKEMRSIIGEDTVQDDNTDESVSKLYEALEADDN